MRDGAHSANYVTVETLDFAVAAAEQMKQQAEGGAWVVGAAMFSVNIVGEKHRLHFFGFVIAIEKIAEAAGQERDELGHLRAVMPRNRFPTRKSSQNPSAPCSEGSGGGSRKNGWR